MVSAIIVVFEVTCFSAVVKLGPQLHKDTVYDPMSSSYAIDNKCGLSYPTLFLKKVGIVLLGIIFLNTELLSHILCVTKWCFALLAIIKVVTQFKVKV